MKTPDPRAPRANRLLIVDLVAMVTLAIAVGLATGVVLGGTVLLVSGNDVAAVTDVPSPVSVGVGR